jgi:hypothetical protein
VPLASAEKEAKVEAGITSIPGVEAISRVTNKFKTHNCILSLSFLELQTKFYTNVEIASLWLINICNSR